MGLRSTHLSYAYQNLLTALPLMDLAVGHAGDRGHEDVRRGPVDDITCEWGTGSHERLQIKHTDHDRALSAESFIKDSRGCAWSCLSHPSIVTSPHSPLPHTVSWSATRSRTMLI